MNWLGKKVLVTGAGGFIGSTLVETLVDAGANVTAFLHYNSRNDPGLLRFVPATVRESVQYYFGDLRDPQGVQKAMHGQEVVFHLGALIGIPYSYVHPHDVVQTNLLGTLNVLMAAKELEVERVIHTSTSEVYGTARYVPIDEIHPLQGQSPYAASKIGADKLAESFHLSYHLPVSTVRPFNTYGPRQSARAIIPTIIVQMLTKERIKLGSLHPRRDFTFVTDTASGFVKAAVSDATIGDVINLGSGQEISIGELFHLIRDLVGRDVALEVEDERMRPSGSEVERLLADNKKAQKLTGWTPSVSFTEGLQKTINWIDAHLDLYQVDKYTI
ncbi:MAG TPA: NAD-dependent dehydratase [Chloroflexi bacterium]|nr:NAD-dependent dehydratase [Chloroflexota bacterium]